MKRTLIFATLMILAASNAATAQPDKTDELMYSTYISKDGNLDAWKAAVQQRKTDYSKTPSDPLAGLRLATAQLGLLTATMRNKDEEVFDDYYNEHVKLLEALNESDKKWAEPRAMLSAAYGLKMGYSPMQGMFLGPKSGNLIEKAKSLDPNSPFVWKVYANSKYFTPETWGGDIVEAIESFEKAIKLYELKPDNLKHNWLYLDALAFQGRAYMKNGDTGKAIAAYEKALKIEPEFGWIKYSLLPKAKAKAQEK